MATKVWKGFLKFSLVTIPVNLQVAARDEHVSLTTFHKPCGGRIKMPKFCEACDEKVAPEDIEKAFDAGTGLIPITKEELDSIAPDSEKVMEITECVEWNEVDPVYLAESFYLLPDAPGKNPYYLLVKALRDTGRVAIAQLTKNNREHIVLIRPRGNGLMAHFIFYPNEVNQIPEFETLGEAQLTSAEHKMAAKLVENLSETFNPEQFVDGYAGRLNALIASKMDSKLAPPAPVKRADTAMVDLTAALEASLQRPKRRIRLEEEAGPKKAMPAKKGKKVA